LLLGENAHKKTKEGGRGEFSGIFSDIVSNLLRYFANVTGKLVFLPYDHLT